VGGEKLVPRGYSSLTHFEIEILDAWAFVAVRVPNRIHRCSWRCPIMICGSSRLGTSWSLKANDFKRAQECQQGFLRKESLILGKRRGRWRWDEALAVTVVDCVGREPRNHDPVSTLTTR